MFRSFGHPLTQAAKRVLVSSKPSSSLQVGSTFPRNSFATAAATSSKTLPDFVLNAPATQVTTLPSGLRVATEDGHGETATVGVWIDAGSRYETAASNGAAHFLEHMAFKGTSKRTQGQLEVEIENLGAHLNAYTSREQTVYFAKCFKKDVKQAMDILSDILQNSTLDPAAMDRERDVILREMKEVEKAEEEVVFDRLHETAFQGSGLGRTILGPKENILSLNRDQLKDYIKTHYTPDRLVIAGAGAVSHSQLVELAQEYFGDLPSSPTAGSASNLELTEKAKFIGSDIRIREDSKGLAYTAIAFEGRNWTSPEAIPVMILQSLLGCWDRTSGAGANMTSPLCHTVAEKQLAHSVMGFNSCYKDTGLFGVYAVGEPTTQNDLVFYTMEAMMKLCHDVGDEEVDMAKTQLKSVMLGSMDGSSQVCEDIGRQMLIYGRRMTPAELWARIDSVDAKQVRDVAFRMMNDQDVAVAALGALHEFPDYNFIRRRTYWNRM